MLCVDFEQLFSYDYFSRKSEKEKAKVAKVGKWKDQDEGSSGKEEGEDLEEVSTNEADEKHEGALPIQGANEDEEEDDSDGDEAEIRKATNCPIHASHS